MTLTRSDLAQLAPATQGVHAGQHADIGNAHPTVQPIHLATAYSYPSTTELDAVFEDNTLGYVYSRMANPTVRAFEDAVAVLEGTEAAVAYASGMAAIQSVLQTLVPAGGTILCAADIYGATHALLHGLFEPAGIRIVHVSTHDLEAFARAALEIRPSVVYVESISNPIVKVSDVRRLAEIAHLVEAPLVLDNTFASPVVVKAQLLGADVILYSSTKHLAGHGDSTGGVVATTSDIAERLLTHRKFAGAILSPFDAWLTLRGMRTLSLRVHQQCLNAMAIANWLAQREGIGLVYYPGLEPDILPRGMFAPNLHGTMLAFEIANGRRDDAFAFQDALRLIQPATTLGDVGSLVLHPATTSHRPLTAAQRAELGIGEGLIRLSAGIEDVGDLIADLDRAINSITRH